jgi:hypothetical protein
MVVGVKPLPVRGIVAAGMWQALDLVQDQPLGTVPMMEDPQYAGFTQWLELIQGRSVDREYGDGWYVHVVDAIAIGYRPQPDDFVIVERRRYQAGLVERTCKKVVFSGGRAKLIGDSTDERWNKILDLEDTPDEEVQVVGLVLGGYKPRRR